MMKRLTYLILFLSLLLLSYQKEFPLTVVANIPGGRPAAPCNVNNDVFSSGEELVYQTSYNWGFIWLDAGQVTFKVEKDQHKGTPCYKLSGNGATYPSYDWIYKVRDRFECWVDTSTLKPYRYIRDVQEGGRFFYNECFFNFTKLKAYCVTKEKKKPVRLDTVLLASCAFDPLTMIYYSRNIDYSKYKPNDTIPISLFLDNKVYALYIRYIGKEKITLDNKQVFNCIKFSPLLVEGTLFKGGEGMTVWATDDKNRIPVYVEAPILVGSVKAKLMNWKGLKNKMEARVQ
ncbi:MAG: DUF3108 domain-containing protein [Bacteroidetes bacterium]|nr:DUF3108 domain-containing protein [Bacteroidota bacterium]